jgi:hypothetical protein
MPKLGDKIKLALDESRMLILGAQILLGFQYRGVFQTKFEALPLSSQYATLVGLAALLFAIALIMWPSAYHRIVRKGNDAVDVLDFTTLIMDIALLPFLVALGIEVFVVSRNVVGITGAVILAAITSGSALFCWYGLGLISRRAKWDKDISGGKPERGPDVQEPKLFDKVELALTEARVVLPGAQALLGFQFAAILIEGFDKLPESSKLIHLGSLIVMALTVVLLMTPAAYHRIVERGEATEHFHRIASILIMLAMISLPMGICGDFFVVVRKISNSNVIATISAVAVLALFYILWFGFTTYQRRRLKG